MSRIASIPDPTLIAANERVFPLTQLREGSRARVVSTAKCCEDCDLLNAMGLTEHCELRVCQRGSTCIVQVNQTRLGLSSEVAGKILVSDVIGE